MIISGGSGSVWLCAGNQVFFPLHLVSKHLQHPLWVPPQCSWCWGELTAGTPPTPGCSQGSRASPRHCWRKGPRGMRCQLGVPMSGGVGRTGILSFPGRRDGDGHVHKHQLNLQRWGFVRAALWQRGFPSARDGDGGTSGSTELLPLCLIWL